MKTAKEMFEALGYDYTYYATQIVIVDERQGREKGIVFNFDEKNYTASLMEEITDYEYIPLPINAKEHLAITQQMKELGWLK